MNRQVEISQVPILGPTCSDKKRRFEVTTDKLWQLIYLLLQREVVCSHFCFNIINIV
jgi:hypothetical protein